MAMLPPSRWEDLATKADVRALEARFDGIDQRLATMEHSLSGQLAALQTSLEGELATLRAVTVSGRQIGLTMAASVAAIGALAVALAALLA